MDLGVVYLPMMESKRNASACLNFWEGQLMCPALGELIESLLCQESALDEVQVLDGLGILKCKP